MLAIWHRILVRRNTGKPMWQEYPIAISIAFVLSFELQTYCPPYALKPPIRIVPCISMLRCENSFSIPGHSVNSKFFMSVIPLVKITEIRSIPWAKWLRTDHLLSRRSSSKTYGGVTVYMPIKMNRLLCILTAIFRSCCSDTKRSSRFRVKRPCSRKT